MRKPAIDRDTTRERWELTERPELVTTFRDQIYGAPPGGDAVELSWRHLTEQHLPGGEKTQRQIALSLRGPFGGVTLTLLVRLPAAAQDVPAFLGLNFRGNHACTTHPDVLSIADGDTSETGEIHYDGLRERIDVPPRRGEKAPRWPFELVNRRGCAVITLCYLQCGPDHAGIFERGIHPVMSTTRGDDRAAGEWGAIGIWAWTLSRVLDALQQSMVPEVAPSKVVAVGHSRLGKTALWAAAQDERFAAVISNDSGCMGAALSRDVGETPLVLARIRPYWFAPRFAPPILAGGAPPVDQSALLACIAPRPLYVASASEDHNADPEGEFLSWREASRAWTLYGHQPVDADFPSPGQDIAPAGTPLGYHLRPGGHDVEPYDWQRWLDFCDRWVVGSRAQERTSSR